MQRILVALDSTPEASVVLRRAVELARVFGAKLRLVRAVAVPTTLPPPPGFGPPIPSSSSPLLLARAEATHVAETLPKELRDGITIEIGAPAKVICDAARAYDADLVVIGAHRHNVLGRMLGTTAARVVNNIDRPVFIVRSSPNATATDLLRDEHARLEKVYDAMMEAYRGGDWDDVRAEWTIFEEALRRHMETEEANVFPSFREADEAAADGLLRDHAELRAMLSTLAIAIDLHAVHEADMQELLARIRAHAAIEARLLYPWMDGLLSPAA